MNIKKGDNVIVVAGKDKGTKGKVVKVFPSANKVVVEGANISKKHKKPTRNAKGSIVEMPMPIDASNVMVLDARTGKQTRVGKKEVGAKMVRISRKTGNEI